MVTKYPRLMYSPLRVYKRQAQRVEKLNIGSKIFLLTFIVEILLITTLGIFTYRTWTKSYVDQQLETATKNTARVVQTLGSHTNNIQGQLVTLAKNIELFQASDSMMESFMETQFDSLSPFVKGIYIVKANKKIIGSPEGVSRIYGNLFPIKNFEELVNNNRLFTWSEPYISPVFGMTITGVKKVSAEGEWDQAILTVDLNLKELLSSTFENQKSRENELFLVDRHGNIITTSKNRGMIKYNTLDFSYQIDRKLQQILKDPGWSIKKYEDKDGKKFFLFRDWIHKFDLNVVMVVNEKKIYGPLEELRSFFIIIGLLGFILCLGVAYLISRHLIRPIRVLIDKMGNENGKIRELPQQYTHRKDEIGQLAGTYNSMLQRIDNQLKTIVELESQKRITELHALQAQIKPHFLYNTLNAIKSMANIYQIPRVANAIASLITLLRFTVQRMDEFVTVDKELDYLKAYIHLMQFQYLEINNVSWDMDKAVLPHYIPKLTLQPLVENAIYHGILPSDREGSITIQGRKEGDVIVLKVIDNGVGFPKEVVDEFIKYDNKASPNGNHIGLKNVHKRLVLYFSDIMPQSSLKINSRPGKGTMVTVSFPALKEIPSNQHSRGE